MSSSTAASRASAANQGSTSSNIRLNNLTAAGTSAAAQAGSSNVSNPGGGQVQHQPSAQGPSTRKSWLRSSLDHCGKAVKSNFWTIVAFLAGFVLAVVTLVQSSTDCSTSLKTWEMAMEYQKYCAGISPSRLNSHDACQNALDAVLPRPPCTDAYFGHKVKRSLEITSDSMLYPGALAALANLSCLAMTAVFWLIPRHRDSVLRSTTLMCLLLSALISRDYKRFDLYSLCSIGGSVLVAFFVMEKKKRIDKPVHWQERAKSDVRI